MPSVRFTRTLALAGSRIAVRPARALRVIEVLRAGEDGDGTWFLWRFDSAVSWDFLTPLSGLRVNGAGQRPGTLVHAQGANELLVCAELFGVALPATWDVTGSAGLIQGPALELGQRGLVRRDWV